MKLDRTVVIGCLGLAAIIGGLGVQARAVDVAAPPTMLNVAMAVHSTCPDTQRSQVIDLYSGKPVGSLSLVLL